MIDKNGKLFGKINLIDFIVIVVLIAMVAVFVVSKIPAPSTPDGTTIVKPGKFTMELYSDEVADYVAEHVKIGSPIYEADRHILMGKVKSVTVAPAKVYSPNSDGKIVVSDKEDYSSITIVGEMEGTLEKFGAVIDGEKFGVGHTFTCRVGKAKIYIKVSDIK